MYYCPVVKFYIAIVILVAVNRLGFAQTNESGLDFAALLDNAQQWAQDNLDDDVLAALQNVDRQQVKDFLKNYQDYLQGDYVLDLAQLKTTANTVLPLLAAHEETQPYAAWLRERLDYFDVADELKAATPTPMPLPGTNQPPPLPNPTFASEQEIWIKKVSPRPWPADAAKYVPKLKAIFAEARVPEAFVWLAEVESGFDARALSPAGALGMFQLMPATAKELGLSLWPFDQRKQLEPSARAAANYLRQLHEKFGDWRLAVAAYNAGPGTVDKWLKRRHATSFEAIATHLPAETQLYVPKVEATILKREGLELEKLKVAPVVQR